VSQTRPLVGQKFELAYCLWLVFTRDSYASRVLAMALASVCVRPSVTLCSPIKTVQAKITKSSP